MSPTLPPLSHSLSLLCLCNYRTHTHAHKHTPDNPNVGGGVCYFLFAGNVVFGCTLPTTIIISSSSSILNTLCCTLNQKTVVVVVVVLFGPVSLFHLSSSSCLGTLPLVSFSSSTTSQFANCWAGESEQLLELSEAQQKRRS